MPRSSKPLTPTLIAYGDSAILIQYKLVKSERPFSKTVNQNVQALATSLRRADDWLEIVPAYDSLLCVFDLTKISAETAKDTLKNHLQSVEVTPNPEPNIIEIPIVYGGDYGPDMEAIKKTNQLSEADVINLHASQPYDVCMMGFIPGFAFLSEAPAKLHHPRHATPRQLVPAGSVGIAGWQTGIYGLDSPGGWQIIGRTPLRLFDKSRQNPFLIKAGDQIRFVPIGPQDFHEVSP